MSDMVQVPDGEDEKEWIAVHAVDFFNRISLIYGTLSDKCTLHSCPSMNHTNGTKVIILTIGWEMRIFPPKLKFEIFLLTFVKLKKLKIIK